MEPYHQLKPNSNSYLDYRVYLKDLYAWKQSVQHGFSQRQLAKEGEFGLGLFTKIVQGERDLSAKVMVKLTKVFEIPELESDDLDLLVLYNQAKTSQEKLERLKDLMEFRAIHCSTTTLENRHYQFYTEWYHSAIREILSSTNFCGSFADLGELLIPPIGARKAKASIKLLTELNLIKEFSSVDGAYTWKVNHQLITSDNEIAKTSVLKFNSDMILKAKEALHQFTALERNISTVTLSLNEDHLPILIEKARKFRQEIMQLAKSDQNSNKVFQLNMQIFPLSHKIEPRNTQ